MLGLSEDGVLGVIAMSGVRVLRGLGFFIITHQLSYVILLIVDNVLIAHVTQLLKGQRNRLFVFERFELRSAWRYAVLGRKLGLVDRLW